jgi:predicted ATPase
VGGHYRARSLPGRLANCYIAIMKMLERESQLATLHDHVQQAAAGRGRLVFLAAEGGGGKTTLVEQLAATLTDDVRMAIVSCDGLKMPGPFGPLFDIATALGPDVEDLLRDHAPRDRIFRAVLSALQSAPQPQILVGEDAHWTDEASLELIRFLGRRLAGTRTLIIVTYREDMLGPYHPLRRVLGDLVNKPAITRMTLRPLSLDAVRTLAASTGIDPVALHERTGGNPFYVTEIVAAGDATLPDSIRDAVLARAAPLSVETRAVLDVAATLGVIFDPDLLEAVIGGPIADAHARVAELGLLPK